MPETRGMPEPERHWATNPFVLEALAMRPDDEYGLRESGILLTDPPDDAEEGDVYNASEEPGNVQAAGSVRSKRTRDTVRAAMADAMGVDVGDIDDADLNDLDDIITNDLTDPQSALAALDAALADPRGQERDKAAPGESDGRYRVRTGNWAEAHGMPRRRKSPRSTSPSQQPEARRRARMQAKARRLGITAEEAEATTRRRADLGKPRGPRKRLGSVIGTASAARPTTRP